MANSKYEYVKGFEQGDFLLPNTWVVVRIDGRGFHRFSEKYNFQKPNDRRALDLMNAAAKSVMTELSDIIMGYGISDEFSFVFHRSCKLFERRSSKLVTTTVSTFTAYYVHLWPSFFPGNLKDYMSWRQVDCHVNNLYNTTFWALVQSGGLDTKEAEKKLAGTMAADKNEILFSQFHINYNDEPEIYKKGSIVYRDYELVEPRSASTDVNDEGCVSEGVGSKRQSENERRAKSKARITVQHTDIIQDEFWERRPWLLSNKPGKMPKEK